MVLQPLSPAIRNIPNGVFGPAGRILNFAGSLVGLTFSLELCVACHLAGGVLHGAFGLLRGALDPVRVHSSYLSLTIRPGTPGIGSTNDGLLLSEIIHTSDKMAHQPSGKRVPRGADAPL